MVINNNKHQGSSSLNEEVGVLKRREIEAEVLGPLLRKIELQLGRTKTRELLQETIIDIAKQQGAELASRSGNPTVASLPLRNHGHGVVHSKLMCSTNPRRNIRSM